MKKRKVKKKAVLILIMIIIGLVIGIAVLFNKPKHYEQENLNNEKHTQAKVEKKNKHKNQTVSLLMVGDVLIHESVYKDALKEDGKYNFSDMFSYIKPILKDYDLKYCNQESIIGGKSLGISGYPAFNSPDEIGDTITDLGFNVIGLANNHAYDKGEKAILYSNQYWSTKDVITAGTYSNQAERDDIHIYEQNGIKYAFLAYTTGINGNNLPVGKEYLINLYNEEQVKLDIDKIKEKVDVIIVAMHWGDEYTNTPTNSEKQIANYLADLGVNLIIGTHPHVVQPIEYINKTLVVYSLGNFISNQLAIGINPAIGLLLGIDITVGDEVNFSIKQKELIYSYSDNSTHFKVIPFSKMSNDILNNYEAIEKEYLGIVGNIK